MADRGPVLSQRAGHTERERVSPGLVSQHAQGGAGCRARHQQVERALIELAELREAVIPPDAVSARRPRSRRRSRPSSRPEASRVRLSRRSRSEPRRSIVRTGARPAQRRDAVCVKQTSTRFELEYHIDSVQLAAETCCDGVFPLITNDGLLSELELLLAYKGQPSLEKRFSHMKTDFEVAPVYLRRPAASRHCSVFIFWRY